jgi:hypothetical protein
VSRLFADSATSTTDQNASSTNLKESTS